MAYEEATSAFLELSYSPEDVSEECLKKLQRFVVLLYDCTSTKMQVYEARKQLFAQKERSNQAIPPTQAALVWHTRQAAYQGGHCWGQALVPERNLPSPSQWGWMQSDAGWKPLWTTLTDISSSCHALIKCHCKEGCRPNCSCIRVALMCTTLCSCGGDCGMD